MPFKRSLLLVSTILLAVTSAVPAAEPSADKDPQKLRLALLRAVPVKWALDANFKTFLTGVDLAAEQKAELLITPECWLDGYASPAADSTPERIRGIAQDLNSSPYLVQVAELARKHRMSICFGFTSLEEGQAYNAAGLWDASGKRLGVYHKTHLQTHDLQYAPGRGLPVWPTVWGKVGIMICADRRWPETTRTLRLQGARLILNPTYGMRNDLNEAMMRTRAYENQCFIAFAHPQQSLVTGPDGRVIAKENSPASEQAAPRILICDIDLSQAKDDNHLRDRRPEIYQAIIEDK
jgi:predicted amidohydrolase